jgi:hypothetical protein
VEYYYQEFEKMQWRCVRQKKRWRENEEERRERERGGGNGDEA